MPAGTDAHTPRRRPRRLQAWWRRYWWAVLTTAAVLAVVLAFVGAEGGFFQRLNTALLLLPVGVKVPDAEISTPLQIARVLAPLVFAYATFKAVFVLFGERFQDVRAGLMKGHTVVCGLGNRGQALVEGLLGSSKVVVIELNPANLAIRRLRDEGAVVLVGDATDPDLLQRAEARRAASVVSVCGQDATNAQVAANLLALASGRPGRPVSAFVHVSDPRLYSFLLHHSFSTGGTRLEFFNVYERGAHRLLREMDEDGGDQRRPVLVIGAGQFGMALISQMARERYELAATSPDVDRLRVYLVDREAGTRAAVLAERYSRFSEVCELVPFELDVQSPAFDRLLERNPSLADIGGAYVCFDSDSLTIACALNLLDQARGRFPVIARVTHRSEGIVGLIRETRSRYADATTFRPVSLAESACTADLVLEGMRGQLAREVHELYRDGSPGTPYDVPWEELSEEDRERSFNHADAIAGQLDAVGYRLGPLIDWGAPLPELSEDDVERMSEIEHVRWSEERHAEGWRQGPTRDDSARTHPDLRPWDEIPEAQREINRRLVRQRPAMLAGVGIEIYRAGRDGRAAFPVSGAWLRPRRRRGLYDSASRL